MNFVEFVLSLHRIEGYIRTHDETRQYAERLIELAKKYGDR